MARWWLDAAMGVVLSLLGIGYRYLYRRTKRAFNEHEALKAGIKALLRDRIVQSYGLYKDKGFWPIYARENMMDMFAQYRSLGGNGVINDLFDALRELPIEGDTCQAEAKKP